MDKLDEIFRLQTAFQDDLKRRRGLSGVPMEKWLQMQTLAMMSELSELIDEVNFKWWKNPHPVSPDAVREELTDILHFFVSMCIEAGVTPDALYAAYLGKNQENFLRQQGKSAKAGYASDDAPEAASEAASGWTVAAVSAPAATPTPET